MASPAKRRKKNDGAVAPAAGVRTLDFFFGKKKAPPQQQAQIKTIPNEQPISGGLKAENVDGEEPVTDEELARRLYEEWNGTPEVMEAVQAVDGTEREDRLKSTKEELEEKKESSASIKSPLRSQEKVKATETTPAFSLQNSHEADTTISNLPLDQDPLTFDPNAYQSLINHFPNGKSTYALLTRGFVLITSTRSRIKIVDTLVNLLRVIIQLDSGSLLPAVWLATNSIGPSYENNELGIGGGLLTKAIMKVSGITKQALKALNNKYGDPGDVAFDAKVRQRTLMMKKPVQLTISNVYDTLLKIANAKGQGSQEVKQRHVERLLVDAKGEEVRYLTRTLIQHLRIGAVKTTMLIALSRAFLLSRPPSAEFEIYDRSTLAAMSKEARQEIYARAEEVVKQCFARRPNYNDIVPVLLEGGIDALNERCGLELHIPLKPMLGSITRDLGEMLVKLQGREFTCEYKYDGQRAQIHCDSKGKVSIFSRHLELMTDKYPDLVALIPKIRGDGVSSFIMEGEVVAVDPATGSLKTFQTLAGRARKDVMIGAVSVNVCVFAFDLMYLNGEQLLSRPFRERRELLRSLFMEIPNQFTWVKSIDATSQDMERISDFFKSALDIKCEGIMVKVLDNVQSPALSDEILELDDTNNLYEPSEKAKKKPIDKVKSKGKDKANGSTDSSKGGRRKPLLSTYEPDKRLESWLKVKKDYDSASDSLDLVPIAAWHGSGRKNAWWSPILLACHNPITGTFEAVCKCMSGFTDSFYTSLRKKYDIDTGFNVTTTKPPWYDVAEELVPDIWFEAQEVWEVRFGDITLSPTYPAARGLVSEERGLSLRFPRFIRVREDKGIEEASSVEFLAGLYERQMMVVRREKEKEKEEEIGKVKGMKKEGKGYEEEGELGEMDEREMEEGIEEEEQELQEKGKGEVKLGE